MTNQRLLIIDDNLSFAQFVCAVAVEERFAPEITTRSEDFMASFLRIPPDVIVLDILMPVMDGIELIQWLGMQKSAKALRVIIATGYYFEYASVARDIGIALGINSISILPKPFRVAALRAALGKPEGGDVHHGQQQPT